MDPKTCCGLSYSQRPIINQQNKFPIYSYVIKYSQKCILYDIKIVYSENNWRIFKFLWLYDNIWENIFQAKYFRIW